jgi:hypothetical protein
VSALALRCAEDELCAHCPCFIKHVADCKRGNLLGPYPSGVTALPDMAGAGYPEDPAPSCLNI